MNKKSLQEFYAPKSICFGCGPANDQGLQIKSFAQGDKIICHWRPQKFHHAFPNVLNGGIIGSLLDCHCNWAAAYYLMKDKNEEQVPSTVTAEYTIKLLRPTPMTDLLLEAKPIEIKFPKAVIAGELIADGKVCATCTGTFVAVKEGHPAYQRWD